MGSSLALRAAGIVVRQAVASCGYKGVKVSTLLIRIMIGAATLSAAATVFIAQLFARPGSVPVVLALLQPVTFISVALTALGIVVVLSSSIDLDKCVRVFMPLPIRSLWIAILVSFPPIAVLLAATVVVLPPLVLVLHRTTGVNSLTLTMVMLPLLGQGFAVGSALTALSRAIVLRFRLGRACVYPLAVGLWVLAVIGAFLGWRDGKGLMAPVTTQIFRAVSLWPVIGRAVGAGPTDISMVALLWVIVTAGLILALGVYYASLSGTLDAPSHGDVIFNWHAIGRLPLVYLQFVKLLRRARIAGSVTAASMILLVLWWVVRAQPGVAQESLSQFSYVMAGSVLAHVPLIARGSADLPAEVALLRNPRSWSWSVISASLLVAACPAIVFLTAMAMFVTSGSDIIFGVGTIVFGCSLGALLGVLMRPGEGMSGAEAGGLFLTGIAIYLCVQILGQAFNDPTRTGLGAIFLALLLLAAGPEIEERRYSSLFG
jgi:hypothetical protein